MKYYPFYYGECSYGISEEPEGYDTFEEAKKVLLKIISKKIKTLQEIKKELKNITIDDVYKSYDLDDE